MTVFTRLCALGQAFAGVEPGEAIPQTWDPLDGPEKVSGMGGKFVEGELVQLPVAVLDVLVLVPAML